MVRQRNPVTGYRRAALRSQTISRPTATITPIVTRTGGWSHPLSIEYRRKNTAASTSAIPATAEKSLTPTRLSQSNAGRNGATSASVGICCGSSACRAAGSTCGTSSSLSIAIAGCSISIAGCSISGAGCSVTISGRLTGTTRSSSRDPERARHGVGTSEAGSCATWTCCATGGVSTAGPSGATPLTTSQCLHSLRQLCHLERLPFNDSLELIKPVFRLACREPGNQRQHQRQGKDCQPQEQQDVHHASSSPRIVLWIPAI